MLRQGSGEPLMLLHGVLGGERIWSNVMALLAANHDVIVPSALGHHGGPRAQRRPAGIKDIIDDAERLLDELGIEQAHLAGNSMGGWMAIDLARRGRALTVCALSPAGAWDVDWKDKRRVFKVLAGGVRDTRRSRAILPLAARSRRLRRWALRNAAVHGERASPAEFLAFTEDILGCEIVEDLLASDARLEALDPPPCPITLAWSARDRLFPVATYGAYARKLIPGARFVVLEGLGHVPMLDNPQMVARTILATTAPGRKTA